MDGRPVVGRRGPPRQRRPDPLLRAGDGGPARLHPGRKPGGGRHLVCAGQRRPRLARRLRPAVAGVRRGGGGLWPGVGLPGGELRRPTRHGRQRRRHQLARLGRHPGRLGAAAQPHHHRLEQQSERHPGRHGRIRRPAAGHARQPGRHSGRDRRIRRVARRPGRGGHVRHERLRPGAGRALGRFALGNLPRPAGLPGGRGEPTRGRLPILSAGHDDLARRPRPHLRALWRRHVLQPPRR